MRLGRCWMIKVHTAHSLSLVRLAKAHSVLHACQSPSQTQGWRTHERPPPVASPFAALHGSPPPHPLFYLMSSSRNGAVGEREKRKEKMDFPALGKWLSVRTDSLERQNPWQLRVRGGFRPGRLVSTRLTRSWASRGRWPDSPFLIFVLFVVLNIYVCWCFLFLGKSVSLWKQMRHLKIVLKIIQFRGTSCASS